MPEGVPEKEQEEVVDNVEKANDIRALWDNTRQNNVAIGDLREVVGRLEVAQSSTQNQMTSEFQQVRELIKGNMPDKPNSIAMATLVVVILTAFGTVITSLNTQTTNSLQRETDMRFKHEASITDVLAEGLIHNRTTTQDAIKDIHGRMLVDDAREQADAFQNGSYAAKQDKIIHDLDYLVRDVNDHRKRTEEWKLTLMERLSSVESGTVLLTRQTKVID